MEHADRVVVLVGIRGALEDLERDLVHAGVSVSRLSALPDELMALASAVPQGGAVVMVGKVDSAELASELVPALTRHLARALAPHVRVNAVMVGPKLKPAAEAAVFLLSGTSFITGSVVSVDAVCQL